MNRSSEKIARLGVLLAIAVGGCTAAAFKPGASGEAMSADSRVCHNSSTNDASYLQCMRDRGWMVSTPGAAAPSQESPSQAPAPAQAAPGQVDAPVVSPPPEIPAIPPVRRSTKEGTGAKADAPAIGVSGWWKLGAGAGDLQRATDACVAKLGEAHRPPPNATQVTAPLHACLQQAGWSPITAAQ